MNEILSNYNFEEIKIGLKKKFSLSVTESLVNDFAKISGDYNPLHMDDVYASSTSFKGRVCHGMLLASFFSKLIGMYLPGKNSLYFSQSLKFQSPCYINDEIIVEGEVIDKSLATKLITIKTIVQNKSGKCFVSGQAKVMMRK